MHQDFTDFTAFSKLQSFQYCHITFPEYLALIAKQGLPYILETTACYWFGSK
jgi:hypothetical protein